MNLESRINEIKAAAVTGLAAITLSIIIGSAVLYQSNPYAAKYIHGLFILGFILALPLIIYDLQNNGKNN